MYKYYKISLVTYVIYWIALILFSFINNWITLVFIIVSAISLLISTLGIIHGLTKELKQNYEER